jgi:hypothetical protein
MIAAKRAHCSPLGITALLAARYGMLQGGLQIGDKGTIFALTSVALCCKNSTDTRKTGNYHAPAQSEDKQAPGDHAMNSRSAAQDGSKVPGTESERNTASPKDMPQRNAMLASEHHFVEF